MYKRLVRTSAGTCVVCRTTPAQGEAFALSASVGHAGKNLAPDVRAVQRALNRLAASAGGANPKLAEDGISGPLTVTAIRHFQRAHFASAQADGRIDVGRQSARKLAELLASGEISVSAALSPDDIKRSVHLLALVSLQRIGPAIALLQRARGEMTAATSRKDLPTFKVNAHQQIADQVGLATAAFNRCFRVFDGKGGELARARLQLPRVLRVFEDMSSVVAHTLAGPALDQQSGRRDYLQVNSARHLQAQHPTVNGVLADADIGGWASKDARIGRIRFSAEFLPNPDVLATFVHEMAHFVGGGASYWIEDHGYYMNAFRLGNHQALCNAESYAWFAWFASSPHHITSDRLPAMGPH